MKTFRELREGTWNQIWGRDNIQYMAIGHEYEYDELSHGDIIIWWADMKGRMYYRDLADLEDDEHGFGAGHHEAGIVGKKLAWGRVDRGLMEISLSLSKGASHSEAFSMAFDLQKKYPNFKIYKFAWAGKPEVFDINEAAGFGTMSSGMTYTDIGHDWGVGNILWYYNRKTKRLVFVNADDYPERSYEGQPEVSTTTHAQIFDQDFDAVVSGRIEPSKKRISMYSLNDGTYGHDEKMFSIAYDLKKMYPDHIIHRFGRGNREMGIFQG